VKLYAEEPGSEAVRALLERAQVVSEEEHLYVTSQGIDALVTRARHTGITSFLHHEYTDSPSGRGFAGGG
jgi:hypothetical protein